MRIVVAITSLLILDSPTSALFFLMRDKGHSNRTARSLMFRVGLSIALFIFILIVNRLGWIHSTGTQPDQ